MSSWIGSILVLCGILPTVWLIARLCKILKLSYSTEISYFSFSLKLKVGLCCVIPVFQIGFGIYHASHTAGASSRFLPYAILVSYILVPTTGWIVSTCTFVVLHRARLHTCEASITFFWIYYASVHLGILVGYVIYFIGTSLPKDEHARCIIIAVLHLVNAVLCIGVFMIHTCTSIESVSPMSSFFPRRGYSVTDESLFLELKSGVAVMWNVT